MRYETLEDLAYAYESGELDESTPLYIDNDDTFVFVDDSDDEDGEFVEGARVYFGGDPKELLIEALDLLGVPNSGV